MYRRLLACIGNAARLCEHGYRLWVKFYELYRAINEGIENTILSTVFCVAPVSVGQLAG